MAAGAPRALEDGRAVRAEARESAARGVSALPCDRGNVGGHVDRVLTLEDVLRHRRAVARRRLSGTEAMLDEVLARRVGGDRPGAEPDLVEDDVLEDALRIALLDVGREGVVEVGADRPARAGCGERVTRAARLREELPAALGVRPLPGVRRAA